MADMSGSDAYNIAKSAKNLDIKGDTKDATKASLKGDVNSLAENETVGKGVEIAANKTNNPYVHAADAAIKMKKNLKKQGVDVNLNKPVRSAATLANPKNRKAIANAAADTAKQKAASFTGKKLAGADGEAGKSLAESKPGDTSKSDPDKAHSGKNSESDPEKAHKKKDGDSDPEKAHDKKKGKDKDEEKSKDKGKKKDKEKDKDGKDKEEDSSKKVKNGAKQMAMQAGAKVAQEVAMKALMLMMLKKFLSFITAAAQAVVHGIAAIAHAIWAGIVSAAKAVGAALAFVGQAILAGTLLGATFLVAPVVVVGVVVMGVSSVASNSDTQNKMRQVDDDTVNCGEARSSYTTDGEGVTSNNEEMMKNAKLSYSVFKAFGMDDDHIAGLFGNIEAESSFNPTVLESWYTDVCGLSDEAYIFGPKKLEIWYGSSSTHSRATMNYSGIEEYWGKMKASYGSKQINDDAYYIHDPSGKAYHAPGIGMHGFTGGSVDDLMDFCDKNENKGRNWWDLDLQLEYFIRGPENGGYGRSLAKYRDMSISDAEQGASYVFSSWEYGYEWGQVYSNWADAGRAEKANKWRTTIVDWKAGTDYDEAYGKDIVEKAKVTLSGGSASGAAKALTSCPKQCLGGSNENIAAAAASFAYDTTDEASGNDGTDLYQAVNKAVIGGDLYQSCDRVACSAVRWAGADDEFPPGHVGTIYDHVTTSDKWEEVKDWNGSDNYDVLQPGDVLIEKNQKHVQIYCSHEVILQYHDESKVSANANTVDGSHLERSAGCTVNDNRGTFAFRNVQPESDSKYKDAVADKSFSSSGISRVNCGGSGDVVDHGLPCDPQYVEADTDRDFGEGRSYESHGGEDISLPLGSKLYAIADADVKAISTACTHNYAKSGSYFWDTCNNGTDLGGYGNYVVLTLSNGEEIMYGHMQQVDVKVGDKVKKGQTIGLSGSTGWSTGPHLHFERRSADGEKLDPWVYLKTTEKA